MPASGPVYQPTTVSYEQRNDWSRPGSYLSQTVTSGLRNPRCIQWLLLALSVFSLAAGLIMVIESTVDFADNVQMELEDENGQVKRKETTTSDVVIPVIGSLLIVLGIILLAAYIRLVRRRKGCPCFPTKEERLARQLDSQAGNGQIHTMNPSTDLLVTAQYGPVSEIAYQPPTLSEQEETHKLMATDNKDSSNEESERMLESDPRIVLRPLSSHTEDA